MIKVIERVTSECRFVANTFREAIIHPMSTSVIDMRSGKLISRHGRRGSVINRRSGKVISRHGHRAEDAKRIPRV